MSSKRKWDEAGPDGSATPENAPKVAKSDESRDASTAAAAAAAIAAKIAAQFSAGGAGGIGGKDPHDGDFVKDIDINDVRNRYLLTKGSTQQQVRRFIMFCSRAYSNIAFRFMMKPARLSVPKAPGIPTVQRPRNAILRCTCTFPPRLKKFSTKQLARSKNSSTPTWDLWWKTRAVAARGWVPFQYLSHILADMSSQRKWPEEKVPVGIESLRNFNVRAKVVGPTVRERRVIYRALAESVIGHVREVHSAGDGHPCADQGSRLWFRGPRNGQGIRRAHAHSYHVCSYISRRRILLTL